MVLMTETECKQRTTRHGIFLDKTYVVTPLLKLLQYSHNNLNMRSDKTCFVSKAVGGNVGKNSLVKYLHRSTTNYSIYRKQDRYEPGRKTMLNKLQAVVRLAVAVPV